MDRWVIVAEDADGFIVIGPKPNHTYRSSETARKDADAIEPDYVSVEVCRVRGIGE